MQDRDIFGRSVDVDEFVKGSGVRTLQIKRQLGVAPDSAGGFLVNEPLITSFNLALSSTGVRHWATLVSTDSGVEHDWPMADDFIEAQIIAEHAAVVPADLTYDVLKTKPYLYSTVLRASLQLWDDRFDAGVMGHLGAILGARIRKGTDRHFIEGDGASKPTGIQAVATALGVLGPKVEADDLALLESAIDPDYYETSGWVAPPAMIADVKSLTTQFEMIDGRPHLRGYPIYSNRVSTDLVFGALDRYLVHDAGVINLTVLTEMTAFRHQVDILATYRSDGGYHDPNSTGALVKMTTV